MEGTVDENSDLISELPLSILHHILSYLPGEDSLKTGVLSKQWNSVRKSSPILRFVSPYELRYLSDTKLKLKDRIGEFVNFVDRSLHYFVQNKLRIDTFDIEDLYIDRDSVPLVDTWLPLALHNGVSDLSFNVDVVGDSHYALLATTFAVSSSLLCGSSKFFRLEKLTLKRVFLSENIVSDIIKNCPNINNLCLGDVYGLKTLNISKLDKLVSLHVSVVIHYYEMKRVNVTVNAISLEKFSFKAHEQYLACKFDLTSCCNLREMTLFGISNGDDIFNQHISRFPQLEVLDLSQCEGLTRIRASLQRLKHLRVFACDDLKAIEIEAPLLSSYEFTRWKELEWPTFVSSKLSFDPHKSRKVVNRVEVGCLDLTKLRINGSWETLLDRMLSFFHPRTILMPLFSLHEWDCVVLCKMLMRRERKYRCYKRHCKCWRHRLKDAKVEITGVIVNEGLMEHKNYPLALEKLSSIPSGSEVRFKLDWDFSTLDESCHGLDFLDRFFLSSDWYILYYCRLDFGVH